MSKRRWVSGAIVLVLAQAGSAGVVSCAGGAPIDESGGTGGTGGYCSECLGPCYFGCEPPGQRCDVLNAPGCKGEGGTGGGSGTECREFDADQGECGTCTATIQSYCDVHDCAMPDTDGVCWHHMEDPRWAGGRRLVTTGCGYFRLERWGSGGWWDVPPVSVDVWNEESGELVYHSSRSEAAACIPDVVAGTDPECSTSTEVCDTGYPCPLPDHFECFGSCFTGCVAAPYTCDQMESLCSGGDGGAGGLGGFGGDAP
jgi:hypothetical protein